jgi:multidrug efflux pump subunit AcrB
MTDTDKPVLKPTQLPSSQLPQTGLIAWFARNSVAANLMMVLIMIAGLISFLTLDKRTNPDVSIPVINISVPYPGAAPEEVEQAVVLRIEEAVEGVDGIYRINSTAQEGLARVNLQVFTNYDINEVLDEVKSRVDSISAFPEQIEKPRVAKQEFNEHVVFVTLYGAMDDRALKEITNQVRDELAALPQMSRMQILGERDYEIAIEVSEATLREYGLTLSEVATAVRVASIDLPGGSIKTEAGNIQLRATGQVYTGRDYGQLVLRSYPDGTRLLLQDIATINDGFVETEGFSRSNGKRSLNIRIMATQDQDVFEIDAAVKTYVAEKLKELPEGVSMDIWGNNAFYLQSNLDMMLSNLSMGAVLVFLVLALFLRMKIAMWVMLGIPISFLGALWLMPINPYPVNINMISIFGFILVLGIVVDDAIIIAESAYTEITEKGHSLRNVVTGVHRVSLPATFGVLTTIAVFLPMLFVGGNAAPFFESVGVVVVLCLAFSLIESKLILPAHLAHMRFDKNAEQHKKPDLIARTQQKVSNGLQYFVGQYYQPLLAKCLVNRYTTIAAFITMLIIAVGLVSSSLVKFEFFPNVPSDFIQVNLLMNGGATPAERNNALEKLEDGILNLYDRDDSKNPIKQVLVYTESSTQGFVVAELTKREDRDVTATEIEQAWRDKVGEIVNAQELRYYSTTNAGGDAGVNLLITGAKHEQLEQASEELKTYLNQIAGVYDVRSSYSRGDREIQMELKDDAKNLGISLTDLGRQVRQSFYGEEAQRIQRGRDEVKVMVRYPLEERRSIGNLENMRVRTPQGDEVPFSEVAEVKMGSTFSAIRRYNRERIVSLSADVDTSIIASSEVIKDVYDNLVPELKQRYPDVNFTLGGASLEVSRLLQRIAICFAAAMLLVYGLLAIPLKSYAQPIIIMSVIPFGFVGALIGHILFGKAVSMMSIFGLIALSGVVVNDSLIMVDFINRAKREGMALHDAVVQAGTQRFRAILLTTLTTFFGLLPIMFETSLTAQMVIPMALSLAFGILFATILTLFFIPSLYLLLEDLKMVGTKTRQGLINLVSWYRGKADNKSV